MPERTIPVVYFSFEGDAALLEQSIRALRFIVERDPSLHIPVYVFDDGAHPLPAVPEGVYYEKTSFPRNGNLMGLDCIRGMVDCYNRVFLMEPAAQVLVKCDCDTILNRMDAALAACGHGCALSGSRWGADWICGQRYAITRAAADQAAQMLGRDRFVKWVLSMPIKGEDMTLTATCRRMPFCKILFDSPYDGIALRDGFSSPFDPALRRFDAVVFKEQTHSVPVECAENERNTSACMMSEYNDATQALLHPSPSRGRAVRVRDRESVVDAELDGDTFVMQGVCYAADPLGKGVVRLRHGCGGRLLIENPYNGTYVLTDTGGNLHLKRNKDWCQMVKCDRLKFACFIISKNGCSCIMASALKYDHRVGAGTSFVWNSAYGTGDGLLDSHAAAAALASGELAGYRKFVVVQDEYERFCRAVNWSHCKRRPVAQPFVDLSLPRHESFMEHLLLYPYMTSDEYNCDQHFLSQRVHLDAAVSRVYGGDRERFDHEVERVRLSDLGEWFADSFGVPMVLNNMDSGADEIYWPDTLTDGEREAMGSVVEHFEL